MRRKELVILVIFLVGFAEYFVGKVPFRYVAPITILGLSVALISFSLTGDFWQPRWADADSGINLLRSLIVGVLCIVGLSVIYMGVEAWLGVLESIGINNLFLKEFSGLAMIGYFSHRMKSRVKS